MEATSDDMCSMGVLGACATCSPRTGAKEVGQAWHNLRQLRLRFSGARQPWRLSLWKRGDAGVGAKEGEEVRLRRRKQIWVGPTNWVICVAASRALAVASSDLGVGCTAGGLWEVCVLVY